MRLGSFYCGVYACGFVLFSILALVSLNIGTQGTLITPLSDAALSKEQLFILYQIRLPRLILAFAAGSILALSGLTYQSLFANPIASPYTLGVSGGSAVGFVVANSFLGIHIPSQYSWIFSAIGGGVTLLFLYPLLRMRSNRSNQVVLLLGVLLSLFSGSLLFFLQYFMDPAGLVELTGWYFGSVNTVGLPMPIVLLVLSIALLFVLLRSTSALDLLMCGREYATSHGVNFQRLQTGLVGLTTLAIAILVSLTGPIGFLGLVTPHFARILVGASHTKLVPVAFFSGGIFLVISDMVARLLGGMQEIPVGLITALIGCPIMATLLVRTLKVQTRDH